MSDVQNVLILKLLKGIMNELLIFFEIIPLAVNAAISVNFPLVEVPSKLCKIIT